MRKHARYFYVLFVLIILSFIFWGVGTVDQSTKTSIATIGNETISLEEYWRAFDRMADVYRDVYKEQFDDKMQEALKLTVLDSLIEERVLYQVSVQAGITVSDSEVQDAVMNEPAFKRDGAFNSDIYRRTLELSRLTPQYFEESKRRELMVRKMSRLVEESVDLTPSEVKGIEGDSELEQQLRQTILDTKKQAAIKSFVDGLKKQMDIKVNQQLIG
jgi:peptidyl-prolyl cis-trans isomerase D